MANTTSLQDISRARPLRLRARTAEDLAVLSSSLQDAIAPIVDMAYEPREKRFVMVVNRFMWEAAPVPREKMTDPLGSDEDDELPVGAPGYSRTNCGLRIQHVRVVRRRGIELTDRGAILNLLSFRAGEGTIQIDFSGGASLALAVDRIDCVLEDLGEPWLTYNRPDHAEADAEAQSSGQPDVETSS